MLANIVRSTCIIVMAVTVSAAGFAVVVYG